MKAFLLLFAISVMNVSYASCNASFVKAVDYAQEGHKLLRYSNQSLEELRQLIKNNAKITEICEIGKNARLDAFHSAIAFKKSRAFYLNAMDECSSPDSDTAGKSADIVTGKYNTNAKLVAALDDVLFNRCGEEPLTPRMSQD